MNALSHLFCDPWDARESKICLGTIAGSSVLGAGRTWLLSSTVTSAVMGGALGAVSAAVTLIALVAIKEDCQVKDEASLFIGTAIATAVVNMGIALAVSALGFPVSIPLSLLYSAYSMIAFFVATGLTQ